MCVAQVLAESDKPAKPNQKGKVAPGSHHKEGVDFAEFLVAREGGGMIPFDKFVKLAKQAAVIDPKTDKESCQAAFDRAKALVAEKRRASMDETAVAAAVEKVTAFDVSA